MSIVYLNGHFLPAEQAFVPVFDRGFIFGDGVYEVLPVYGARPFRLAHHLDRLGQSLAGIGLTAPLSAEEWGTIIGELIVRHGGGDQSVYLQITRGAAPRDHAFPAHTEPTVFAYTQPLKESSQEVLGRGVRAVTLDDIRWRHCDIKATALLANVLLRQEAIQRGAAEAILVRDGAVTEGAASNIFVALRGQLVTAPRGPSILPGITRDLILELAAANGIDFAERSLPQEELRQAEEVWMTSSTKEIMPIVALDGQQVGNGTAGPLFWRMHSLFQDYKRQFRAGTAH
ncbi:MAG: D-amino acid aminotransferase [Acidiferrobacteraceae bacterium]